MTLKVWRSNSSRYLVECDKCSSHGTSHVAVTRVVTPEIAAAVKEHAANCATARAAFDRAAAETVEKVKRLLSDATDEAARAKVRSSGAAQLKDIYWRLASIVLLSEKSMPDQRGKVTETVAACPWCGNKSIAVVEQLDDGRHEPASWLTKGRYA